MPLEFRPLEAADYHVALALWNAVPGVRAAETREEFERILLRNPGLSCSAFDDGRLIGAVLCGHDGRRGYLYHLAVAESYRGQGTARRLVDHCLRGLVAEKITRCSIFLIHDNEEGAAFWRRIGWRERIDLRVMAIDLDVSSAT